MFSMLKKKKKHPPYVSKHNSNREKQIILLMILNGGGWHYLAVKNLSALFRGKKFKHHGDFNCLNLLHSFAAENKRESHKKLYKNKDFCNVVMCSKDTNILEFNKYQKSDKAPFFIYADLDCLIEKIDGYKNNPENSSAAEVGKHIMSDFSMPKILLVKNIKTKHDVYRSKDCMKKFCESLREHTMKRINFINKRAAAII